MPPPPNSASTPPKPKAGAFEITSPSTGSSVGTTFDVCGIAPPNTAVTVTFLCGSLPAVTESTTSDAGGKWCVTFTVPVCPAGATITATDGASSDTLTGVIVSEQA